MSEFASAVKALRAVYWSCCRRCCVKPCSQVTAGGLGACHALATGNTDLSKPVCLSVWGATIILNILSWLVIHTFHSLVLHLQTSLEVLWKKSIVLGKCKAFQRKQESSKFWEYLLFSKSFPAFYRLLSPVHHYKMKGQKALTAAFLSTLSTRPAVAIHRSQDLGESLFPQIFKCCEAWGFANWTKATENFYDSTGSTLSIAILKNGFLGLSVYCVLFTSFPKLLSLLLSPAEHYSLEFIATGFNQSMYQILKNMDTREICL